jgi:hypothetical protein
MKTRQPEERIGLGVPMESRLPWIGGRRRALGVNRGDESAMHAPAIERSRASMCRRLSLPLAHPESFEIRRIV